MGATLMKIMVGCDHRGIEARINLARAIRAWGYEVVEVGPTLDNPAAVDYPDVAAPVARAVSEGKIDRGILICGTGIGMSVVANKFPGVRAAPVADVFTAELSRRHNDLNVLCLSAELLPADAMIDVADAWLRTEFSGEPRHARRLGRVAEIENEQIELTKRLSS